MTTPFDTEILEGMIEAENETGTTVTITYGTPGYSVTTGAGSLTPSGPQTIKAMGFDPLLTEQLDEGAATTTQTTCVIRAAPLTGTPTINSKLAVDGRTYNVTRVEAIKAADDIVGYILTLRAP